MLQSPANKNFVADVPNGHVCPTLEHSDLPWDEALRRTEAEGQLLQLMHFIYILRCADGTLYTGYARDVEARTKVHNTGKGAKYTAGRRPVELVYYEAFTDLSAALKREHELKRWTKAQKEVLISGQHEIKR